MLDSRRIVETPEGVELRLPVAGMAARSMAWLLDALIRMVIYIILATIFGEAMGRVGEGILLIVFFVLEWFYPVLFEVYMAGATPGKKTMSLRVVRDNGTPVRWADSLVRNLLRFADFLPFLYGFGFVAMAMNSSFKRLGDMAAGTVVVYVRDTNKVIPRLPEVEAIAPHFSMTLEEREAIVSFAERQSAMTSDRAEELADILEPVLSRSGKVAVNRLLSMANWIVGGR